MGPAAMKVILQFADAFWPLNMEGVVCADCFVPELWFESHELADGDRCFTCTLFFMGKFAERAAGMRDEERIAAALKQLDEMFADRASPSYVDALQFDWGQDPFIRGGYSHPALTESRDTRVDIASPLDNVVFFAGEATGRPSMYEVGQTVHGAIDSGCRAANEVLSSLMTTRL